MSISIRHQNLLQTKLGIAIAQARDHQFQNEDLQMLLREQRIHLRRI